MCPSGDPELQHKEATEILDQRQTNGSSRDLHPSGMGEKSDTFLFCYFLSLKFKAWCPLMEFFPSVKLQSSCVDKKTSG